MNYTPNSVIEGQSVTLCCSSDSRPPTTEMWWVMGGGVLSIKEYTDVICHEITSTSRGDSGSYKCFAENKVGIVNDEVIFTVLYPPKIPEQHIKFTETDVLRTLHCLAYGVPATYSYGRWQHLSFFGEHIRYLNTSYDGKVTLPQIANQMERYQDNGIYLCIASNQVTDRFGNIFQTGKIFVISNGPPVFVKKIEHKQYGKQGKIFNMKLIVYSTTEIECYDVKSENKEVAAYMQMPPINSTMVFHDTEISVKTMEIVLSFNISNKSSRQNYTVTLCNGYSNSSFVVYSTTVPVDKVYLRRKRKIRTSADISESETIEDYNSSSYIQEQNAGPLTGQLNYADVIFPPSTTQDGVHIIGIENKTVYADVTVSRGATSLGNEL